MPSLNLESFGCPKAEGLIERLVWLETCGNHTTADAYLHCPKVEVEAFGHWMQDALLRQQILLNNIYLIIKIRTF